MDTLVSSFISDLGSVQTTEEVDLMKMDYFDCVQPYDDLPSAMRYFMGMYPNLPIESVQRYACQVLEKPFNSKTKRFLKRHEDEYLNDDDRRKQEVRRRLQERLKNRNKDKNEKV